MAINDVIKKFSKSKIEITIELRQGLVIVEADKNGLEFLGALFAAQAKEEDCGVELGPKSAGKNYFKPKSKLGLYIHRLPCKH